MFTFVENCKRNDMEKQYKIVTIRIKERNQKIISNFLNRAITEQNTTLNHAVETILLNAAKKLKP
jgi:hypothetical protein